MTLRLYNTATRKKEVFHPIEEGRVGIYVCGVTVYDLCHMGHARSTIVFDVLTRYLRARGFRVTYVRNFTDVDDKIIERARVSGRDVDGLAKEFIDAFYEDMGALGVLKADVEPRATGHIDGMIHMIKTLLDRHHAYVSGTDVYFSVTSFKEYGSLSGRKLDDMRAGSRIAVDEKKRHPMDFVLWKGAKDGEPQWPSPWGPGRPGWHLECSVMSSRYLGTTFDIHGGGRDLLFPHHENERAQSICANGGGFARFWVHNGFVTVESEKMSKSLGNFLTIRDALKDYHPETLRLFLISRQYRGPLDFSREDVLGLQSGLVRIYRTIQRLEEAAGPEQGRDEVPEAFLQGDFREDSLAAGFIRMMDDDLNTSGAIGLVFDKIREMNRTMDGFRGRPDGQALAALREDRRHLDLVGRVLGLFQDRPQPFFERLAETSSDIDESRIQALIQERSRARSEKDWARSDQIRDRLKEMGVILQDGPDGTTWRLDV
ncbi:MAG TPA: cysteine--tRNA ligase [Deltaproteobacteria bacterium]|nr:cysteine--tRNA ligase [Deltaproteobacteria bacterium]